jgi:hypothetical protein
MEHGSSQQMAGADSGPNHHQQRGHSPYGKLAWMMLASFIAMYILMYAMVDRLENVVPNFNQFYMAGLMTSAMLVIELLLMRKMYPNKRWNTILMSIGFVFLILFFLGIRKQAIVGDKQFLKSMIPHHAAAILMVKEANLQDPEIKALGDSIIATQQKEIEFMKEKLKTLGLSEKRNNTILEK